MRAESTWQPAWRRRPLLHDGRQTQRRQRAPPPTLKSPRSSQFLNLPLAIELLDYCHLLQLGTLGNHVKLYVTPQIHHQPPRHRDDSDSPHPCPATTESPFIPLAQLAVGL